MNQRGTNSTNRTVTLTNASGNRGVLVLTVPGDPKAPPTNNNNGISNQGAATLIVMCCVLTIIMLFCCLAAPGIRDLCKRYVFRQCVIDDPDVNNVETTQQQSPTPTLILLPFGRMLVIDRSMLQALQVDPSGVDFLELSRHIIRNQSLYSESTGSILDYDTTTSKGLTTPDSLYDLSPPTYEDVIKEDLPPAYSDLNLLYRTKECDIVQNIEMIQIEQERHLDIELTHVIDM